MLYWSLVTVIFLIVTIFRIIQTDLIYSADNWRWNYRIREHNWLHKVRLGNFYVCWWAFYRSYNGYSTIRTL